MHDRKRSLIISSCFPGQQIPALPDLPLLTGNDYSWHARPFNEVRIKGFTEWIFGCSKMFNLLDSSQVESFPDMIMWSLAESLKLLARYIIMHYQ